MNITLNDDKNAVTINDRFKDLDPCYILGRDSSLCGLNRRAYNRGSGEWLYRGIPALLNILLIAGWTVTIESHGACIIKDKDNDGSIKFTDQLVMTSENTDIERWHGDILTLKHNDCKVAFQYKDLKSFKAVLSSGVSALSEYSPATLVATQAENPDYIDVQMTCYDTRFLAGIVCDYTGDRQYHRAPRVTRGLQEFEILSDWRSRELFGNYIVKSELELEYFLILFKYIHKSHNSTEMNRAIECLRSGDSIMVKAENGFNFKPMSDIASILVQHKDIE